MKLKIETKANLFSGRVTAQLEKKQANPALQNMLKKLQKGGFNALRNDDELKTFADGLIEAFKRDGYIADEKENEKNPLSKMGNEIANTGKNFEQLSALFDISFLENEGKLYLLKCDVVGKDKNENGVKFQNVNLPGKFFEEIYKTEGEFEVLKLKLENNNFLQSNVSGCSVTATYDFSERKVLNDINSAIGKISFVTTDNNKFYFINSESATQFLKHLFKIAEFKNCFAVNDDNSIVVEAFENEMPFDLWKQIWEDGCAALEILDENETENFHFSDIRFVIDNESVCAEALKHYLMFKAETAYIGKSETGRLVNDFYKLFEDCPDIDESTDILFQDIKEAAVRENNTKALLRLQAYQDLCPNDILKDYVLRQNISFGNREVSFADFVYEVFGDERNVSCVAMFSKYLSENVSACRAVCVVADELKKIFGVKMKVVTSEATGKKEKMKTENKFFADLKNKADASIEKFDEIKDIHDRYWMIIRDDGKKEFFITSGELDAIKFENDFTNSKPRMDITAETKGRVKEMTVTFIDERALPEKIKKYFCC